MIRHLGAVMDHATVDGATLGRSLRGVGLNILTRDAGALALGGTVIEPPRDKPHGLRETTILAPEGQSFTAAKAVP